MVGESSATSRKYDRDPPPHDDAQLTVPDTVRIENFLPAYDGNARVIIAIAGSADGSVGVRYRVMM